MFLTPGLATGCAQAEALLAGLGRDETVIGERACDTDAVLELIGKAGAAAVIPSMSSRKSHRPFDRATCRKRNLVEGFLGKFKEFRRFASRFFEFTAWDTPSPQSGIDPHILLTGECRCPEVAASRAWRRILVPTGTAPFEDPCSDMLNFSLGCIPFARLPAVLPCLRNEPSLRPVAQRGRLVRGRTPTESG